ncbi:SWI SNF2 family ATPase [Cryptosporidium felis]|nr:SWI SNF2 family ATPase [Cryptosporidium felis]
MKSRNRFQKNKLSIEIEPPKEIEEDHRDFLLKECKWMYDCFVDEHKWKVKSFKSVAQFAVRYLQTKDQRLRKRKEEEDKRLKLISKNISFIINKFWCNISKIVRRRKIGELNKLLRIKQFEKLDKLVSETENYYYGVANEPIVHNTPQDAANTASNPEKVINDTSDSDVDMCEWELVEEDDNKYDLEMESDDNDEIVTEIQELNEDANLNLEELYLKYYGTNHGPGNDGDNSTKNSIENSSKNDGLLQESEQIESDQSNDYIPHISDEDEIEAEKEMSDADKEDCSNWEEECNALEAEAKLPLEELISRLKQGDSAGENESENNRNSDIEIKPLDSKPVPSIKTPFLLRLNMREYQHAGLEWLVRLYSRGLNGILADEMGLGKTIQTISLLAYLACYLGNWGPHLIVVPTSVMLNWEIEFKRWLPSFKVLTYFGSSKERQKKRMGWNDPNAFNVCIASYTLILQDAHIFKRKQWKYLILDEAQNIKNFRSQKWQVMLSFNTERRLLLTGTPLQNNLMELWSLLHFLMPHIFTSHHDFKTWFSDPLTSAIENQQVENERNLLKRLHSVLRPFLLRRLKKDVEKEMPSKIEHVVKCPLSKRQKELYDEFLESKSTQNTIAGGDYIGLMNILMQLRKVCNHPDLFEPRLIKTPIFERSLMVEYSFNSLVVFPNISVTSTSGIPTLGKNISTNNRLFVGKNTETQTNRTLFDKMTNNRFINLPNLFLLHNEIFFSRIQHQSQNELKFEAWLDIYEEKDSSFDSLLNSNFTFVGHLPDIDHFIRLNLNSIGFSNGRHPLIGIESEYKGLNRNRNIQSTLTELSRNKVKSKTNITKPLSDFDSTHSLYKDCEKKLIPEWKPSCNYYYLQDESIQEFHDNHKNCSYTLKQHPQSLTPINVIYGKDLRDFIKNEFQNVVSNKQAGNKEIIFSSFPRFTLNSNGFQNIVAQTFIFPLYFKSLYRRHSTLINPITKISNDLLFVKPDFSCQFHILKQFTILLEKKVESTNDSISMTGKYSILKNEVYYKSYITPEVKELIHLFHEQIHKITFLQKCLIPPRRIIEDDCGKFQVLSNLLHKLYNKGHRCIIFTQMSKMLDVLESFINFRGYNYLRLDGSTKVDDRQKLVNRFNRDQRIYLFISSTRSGGVGLNLTGADTVIFYDSDWNPAMDRQAMDRCHRIGQTRDVNIYRLISEWTIEESIFRKQLQKRLLDDVVVDQGHFTAEFITKGDIQKMVGSRNQYMLSSGSDDIYKTRILHEGLSSSNQNDSISKNDPNRKEFEEVLAAIEDVDDVSALKKSSKELAAENDNFNNEFEDKLKVISQNTSQSEKNEIDQSIQVECDPNSTLCNLLKYCIEFFDKVSVPPEIQKEIELLEFQINNVDYSSSNEEQDSDSSRDETSYSEKSDSGEENETMTMTTE